MTVKEAILKSLDDIKGTANSMDICSHISGASFKIPLYVSKK